MDRSRVLYTRTERYEVFVWAFRVVDSYKAAPELGSIAVGCWFAFSGLEIPVDGTLIDDLRATLHSEIASKIGSAVGALVTVAMVKTLTNRAQAKWDTSSGPHSVPTATASPEQ